jgi:hypothetical protein
MKLYTVHAKPAATPGADLLGAVFVKEGFCWPALLPVIAIPWMIFRRLWGALVLYVLVLAALAVLSRFVPDGVAALAAILLALLFALEANQFRRRRLSRAGYRLIGVAEGRGRSDAEIRFFARPDLLPDAPVAPPPAVPPPAVPPAAAPAPAAAPVIGLFPAPGGAP